jgi:uncharacterized DUF497 family protein
MYCYFRMSELFFEWDAKKASSNAAKHGVTFEEAKSVFYDADALIINDPDHSANEERFVMMGQSASTGVLVVAHCYRCGGSSIRIISARRAGTKEQQPYWEKIHAKRI